MADDLARFLPSMLRGLFRGEGHGAAKELAEGWIREGKHLRSIASYLRFAEPLDFALLLETLKRSKETNDADAVIGCVLAAETQYRQQGPSAELRDKILMDAIRYLRDRSDIRWVEPYWMSWLASPIMKDLSEEQAAEVLEALLLVPRLEHNSEYLVGAVGAKWPERVIEYLGKRLAREVSLRGDKVSRGEDRYEAMPFSIHALREVLHGFVRPLVGAAREWFTLDKFLYEFRGGHFLAEVFGKKMPDDFKTVMLEYADGGPEDKSFVLRTLAQFHGAGGIFDIVREVVARLPPNDVLWSEAMTALEASGVVHGEYGFVDLYIKRKAIVDGWKADANANVRAFADEFSKDLENRINSQRRHAEESIAMRRLEYDEDLGDLESAHEESGDDDTDENA